MFSEGFKTEINKTIKVAVPIMIAQLGVILMGVTDNVVVGRLLGKTALGAAGIANSIAFLMASLAIGGLSVVAPLVSKAKAERNISEINRLYRAAVKVSLIFGLVLGIIGFITVEFFEIFQQPSEITALAPQFLLIMILSNIPLFLFHAGKQLSDGLSNTSVAMYMTILGLVLNLVFNLLLINGNLGFPRLGLNGSAVSTLITRTLMAIVIFWYLHRSKNYQKYFQEKYKSLKINDLVSLIFKIGIPSGLQFFFEIAAFSLAVVMMGWLGTDRLAAHQVAINIGAVTYMMASGIGYAGAIRVGEGRGLSSVSKIKLSGNVALVLVILFMTAMMTIIIVFDKPLVEFYIIDNEVLTIALKLLVICAFFQLSDGVQVVALGVLRGISDVNIPTWITMFAYWGIALPLGYYLGFSMKMDAIGIWIGLLAGLTVSAVLNTIRFYYLLRKMRLNY
jgi:MATE family multidrug resistance protein